MLEINGFGYQNIRAIHLYYEEAHQITAAAYRACLAHSPNHTGWVCTRGFTHEGIHIAGGSYDDDCAEIFAIWDDALPYCEVYKELRSLYPDVVPSIYRYGGHN